MRNLLITLTLMMGTSLIGQTIKVNPNRTIRMIGEVNGSYLSVVGQLDRLSNDSDAPIFLLINSPGGSIFIGNLVINAMHAAQSRGVKLHCASTLLSASMAFQFYVECDYRYAMKHTKLLFHPPRIFYQGILLAEQMKSWLQELKHIEDKMIPVIQSKLGMNDEDFQYHYHVETLWDAEDLKNASDGGNFLMLIDDIQGIDNIFQYRPSSGGYNNGLIWIPSIFMNTVGE